MRVLVLNSGSSSLKFEVIERGAVMGRGSIDRIGGEGRLRLEAGGQAKRSESVEAGSIGAAVETAIAVLGTEGLLEDIDAVGHRVVHGGQFFTSPVVIDEAALGHIEALNELAPLHNAPALDGIRAVKAVLPELTAVAVFDTAFYADLPEVAAVYAIPRELSKKYAIRRYGFHGLAHRYMTERFARLHTGQADARLITLQLGNGCSATASIGGRPVETSMGFTPLEGLIMGTRSGDLDPALPGYIAAKEGLTTEEVEAMLNRKSGLLGLSGRSSDVRDLVEAAAAGDLPSRLAVDAFCHRVRKYVGAYLAILGGADAILFGGGIGENNATVRAQICLGFEWAGLHLDAGRNNLSVPSEARISTDASRIETWVMQVGEAAIIAADVEACLSSS